MHTPTPSLALFEEVSLAVYLESRRPVRGLAQPSTCYKPHNSLFLFLLSFSKFPIAASVLSFPLCFDDGQEQQVDSLRYLDLPAGDHSLEVEGLGRFAPQGSYAHDTGGGLGDQEDQVTANSIACCLPNTRHTERCVMSLIDGSA